MRKWGVREWVVSPMRVDSRRSWWTPAEAKVTVIFTPKGAKEEQRFMLASQDRPQDNLRALYLGLEAMRMNEQRGISEIVREMYLQLPAPAKKHDPYEVLGIRPDAPLEVAESVYRVLAKSRHPDAGGSEVAMTELNEALAAIKEARR